MAYLLTQETSAVELKHSEFKSRKKGRQERRGDGGFDEVMFGFFCQDVILWSLSMKDIN